MKKGLLVAVLITAVIFGAFAQVTGVGEPTVSGNVSVTAGYDLDNEGMGFINDSSVSVSLPLVDGSATTAGDDDAYGSITIDGIGWSATTDGLYDSDEDSSDYGNFDASIAAKIVLGDLYFGLGGPGFSMNNSDLGTGYAWDANAYVDDNMKNYTDGFSVGYTSDMFDIEVKVASEGNYTNASDDDSDDDTVTTPFDNDVDGDDGDAVTAEINKDMNFVFGFSATVKPMDDVSIPLSFSYDAAEGDASILALGMNPTATFGAVTVKLPLDFVSYDKNYGLDMSPSIAYAINDGASVTLDSVFGITDYSTYVNPVLDLTITLSEAGGFVEGLTFKTAFGMTNLLDYANVSADMGWNVDVDTEYDANGFVPVLNFGYGSDEVFDLGVGAKLTADMTGIDNTLFTVMYVNEALSGDSTESGRITACAKVTF